MSTIVERLYHAGSTTETQRSRRSVSAATRLAGAWQRYIRQRRTERALEGLSEATLKDIGIHRSEIRRVSRDAIEARDWRHTH
ncbi:MAG TPA: DUF1127 domain-containing protein [Hyphomicrobiaceae bacterium]|nr:DUF1127 domain-containing protein [Hyphomicrobiaceae bacterium]